MTAASFRLRIVSPLPPRSELPLSLCPVFFYFYFFLPTSVCRGRALQLIRDLPVEFLRDKGSYSCRQDGEKAALAAAIALLRRVSKMKRLHFEDTQALDSLSAAQPSPPSISPLVFCHLSSCVAVQCVWIRAGPCHTLSAQGLNS